MKRIVDKEEMRVNWLINHWYEKVVYVVGYIFTAIMVVSFIVGFISGLME